MLLLTAVAAMPPLVRASCPANDLGGCTARCDAGDATSCASLGAMYEQGGAGVRRNDRRAVELFRKACDGGNAQGCTSLRSMYSQGRGVGRQYDTQDAQHYRQQCDSGRTAACEDLGRMYESGRGVARDSQQARALYARSCQGGNASGCRRACAAGDRSSCERAPAR